MEISLLALIAIFIVSVVALVGFFGTKAKGFGRYATSTLLLLVVVIVSALLFASGKIEVQILANVFFAIIGFAGGLFACRDSAETKQSGANDAA